MRLLHIVVHPETRGLNRCADLTDPHTTTIDAPKILPRNRATMVADREVAGEEEVAERALPMDGS
jgi:hypothetical protein